ncbi:NAD(P)H-dependent oxidoreductase [Sinomicrobium kalidii]|uniref:NAD(P)H-dependent oxidoreductase n=1 Tax=Sinomicrobium kalidii TaxID=2900738 RepID=UPI001E4EDDFE|nr:NAD(P)H-dependent oxidoreductase [Sinomicrobium kalidii]UGU16630.1 NAD(P)H-dependent oxidoreductase [Sinomicrobium kalidii]
MELTENLKWRYATKKFDPGRKVAPEDLEKIKEAIRLSASSYGLQLYKVLIIEDRELREKLKSVSWGQHQITDASHLIVFCNYTRPGQEHVEEYINLKAGIQEIPVENLKSYSDFMVQKLSEKSLKEQEEWTARQTYLALGNLLAACAELRIDTCPMEGFQPDRYNEILGLSDRGLNTSVLATIGYRSAEDTSQYEKKVRKPGNKLFEEL